MPQQSSLTPLKMLLFSFHATDTIILSYLPLYLEYKELNGTEIGWVLAVGPLAAILAQPFWGYLSDKYKTVKYTLMICVIGLLFSGILFFQMNELVTILAAAFIFFFFTSPIGGLGDSLGQRRADELGISFGSIRAWGSIGFATSSLIVGQILTAVGIQHIIWPYLLFGTIALIVTFILEDVHASSESVQLKDASKLIKNKPFMLFLLFVVFITISHRTSDSFIGLYITQLGGNEGLVGIAWFVGVASEAIVLLSAGKWFRQYHTLVFIIFAGLIYTLRWFIYAFADSPLTIISLQFLHGVTFGVFYVAAFDYITRLIPKVLQSTGHLMFYAVFFGISGIVGSLLGGALIDTYGGSTLYAVLALSSAIGTVCLLIYHILTNKQRSK